MKHWKSVLGPLALPVLALDVAALLLQPAWMRGGFGFLPGDWGDIAFLARFILVLFVLTAAASLYWLLRAAPLLFSEPPTQEELWPRRVLYLWLLLHLWGLWHGLKTVLTMWPYL